MTFRVRPRPAVLALLGLLLVPAARAAAPAPAGRRIPPGAPGPVQAPGGYFIPRGFSAEIVTIACDDEYRLAADYLKRARVNHRMPGVIFLHDEARDRHAFYPLTIQTAGRGCAVLAPDLRWFGENPSQKGNPPVTAARLSASEWAAMLGDVRNAVSFLAIKNEVDGGRVALVGVGVGANLALMAAGEPWAAAVQCVIAVSPVLDAHGLAPLAAVGRIPKSKAVYLAARREDAASRAACDAFLPLLRGPHEFFESESGQTGPAMLGQGLFQKIPQWLHDAIVKPSLAEQGTRGGGSPPR